MTVKENVRRSVEHKPVDSIPMMYRGLLDTDKRLCKHFGLESPEKDWQELLKRLNADIMSTGYTLSKYLLYFPEYNGPFKERLYNDHALFYAWGLDSAPAQTAFGEYIHYAINAPLKDASLKEIVAYRGPALEDFNFDNFALDLSLRDEHFFCTGILNYIFILASWMRGQDQFFVDLAIDQQAAAVLVDKIGEFAVDLTKEIYRRHGGKLDMFGMWDDVADQRSLCMRPEVWRKLFKKWDRKIIDAVKKYDQIVLFHCCGNCKAIIPDFIEIGVDILDPVQTSATGMDLAGLKASFGNDLCFHGGIDVQKLLPFDSPQAVKEEVRRIKDIFGTNGGLILGPSHEIPNDVPLENIIAIYSKD
jgi:uroporphyrinogen decarboxylase